MTDEEVSRLAVTEIKELMIRLTEEMEIRAMQTATDDRTRMEFQRFIDKMEQM